MKKKDQVALTFSFYYEKNQRLKKLSEINHF